MATRELKTRLTEASVVDFLQSVENEDRKNDSFALLDLMARATGEKPGMWGSSIVGLGTYSYVETSGKRHSWMATGFSPRKAALTIYIMPGFSRYQTLLDRLGPHKTGKSCLYVKRLSDIDTELLEELVVRSYRYIVEKFSGGAAD